MALDKDGILYFTQNNWGREEQFVGILKDPVRVYESGDRLGLEDEVEREITQRILEYDPGTAQLYLVRVGERDEDPSILQVIDPAEKKVVARVALGITATDLVFDDEKIYVANFGSSTVSAIDKTDFAVNEIEVAKGPLRLCSLGGRTYVISHLDNRLQELGGKSHKIPFKGLPDNIFAWGDIMILTSHNDESMAIMEYDPDVGAIKIAHRQEYPYGDVRFDTPNVSFYVKGQFGDAVFGITSGVVDAEKRLWISDFLAGKLYIVEAR
jgi:YVTN family beta-propeller protein